MFDFLQNIFIAITSIITAVLVGVGLIAAPEIGVTPSTNFITSVQVEERAALPKINDSKPKIIEKQLDKPQLKTFTTPSGAIVDEKGNITNKEELDKKLFLEDLQRQSQQLIETIKVPQTPAQNVVVPQIISVNVSSTGTLSRVVEWQTNLPTESKIFVWYGNSPASVHTSQSGFSTRHSVPLGLVANKDYLFEIEAITKDGKVVKQTGQFQTPDLSSFIIEPDKTTVRASGFDVVKIKLYATDENGKGLSGFVNMTATDSTQNQIRDLDATRGTSPFIYYPRIVGEHQLTFSFRDMAKTVTITAIPYVEQKPKVELMLAPTSLVVGYQNTEVAKIQISVANDEETIRIDEISYDIISGNFSKSDFNLRADYINTHVSSGSKSALSLRIDRIPTSTGTFKFKITGMKVVGIQSGLYREVDGLPILTNEIEVKLP